MMFRLFMGSFETIINDPECGSVMLLKLKLEHFYSRVRKCIIIMNCIFDVYIQFRHTFLFIYFAFNLFQYLLSLKLNNSDILDVFQGLQFLPLDKITFLKVQCFMNLVEAMFTQVKYTAFLYNDQVVW